MKAKRRVWDFDEWFSLHHGPRPGGGASDQEMQDVIRAGDNTRGVYRQRLDWDNRRTSALYAWQVSDAAKPKARRKARR